VIVLDTTVLVYAVGAEHALREPCRRLIEAVEERLVDARTTVEVLQEFIHVRAKRRGRGDAVALGRSYLALLEPLLPSDEARLREGLLIYQSTPRVGMFDAVVAAVAMDAGAILVSADRGFASVTGLSHVHPTRDGVAALLA